MPGRLRPPTRNDAPAVLDVILARDVADVGVHERNRGALRLYESVGMRAVSESERWEKPLAGA